MKTSSPRKEEAAEQRAQFDFRHLERGAADVVEHARVGVEHLVLILREVFADDVVASRTVPAVGVSTPVSSLMSVDLPAPLTPTSATRSPRSMVKRAVAEDLLFAVALRESFRFDHHAAGGRRLRKPEVDDRLFFGNLDALDLFQLLDARLHLLGLGRLGAEAIDEGFEVLDLFALVAVGGEQLRAALVFLREILGVVALVDLRRLFQIFDGAVDGDVEKVAVVRDEDVAEGIVLEVVLEPVARLEIEMVGRLVEQQQVGLGEQQLGERDAHLPAAAELVGQARPVLFAEAEAGEHGAHLGVECVAVEGVEALLQQGEALGGGFVLRARRGRARPVAPPRRSISPSISRISSKTVRHSSKTVRPVSRSPSCGR